MARPRAKHDRVAFVACTAVALAIVVVMWVLGVRSVVADGLAGTKAVLSDVASTASDVKQQTAPDKETIDAIKAGIKTVLTQPAEDEGASREAAVGAAAEIMAENLAAEETTADEMDVLLE